MKQNNCKDCAEYGSEFCPECLEELAAQKTISDCRNDGCVKCDCDICNPKVKVSSNWQWQDSGIELGF
jgi:hypothetical protein